MNLTFRPTGERLVVEPFEPKDPESVIILPDSAKSRPMQARVLAVGPGKRRDDGTYIPVDIKPGQVVAYAVFSGVQFHVDGKKLLILEEKEVVAIVEGL